MNFHYPEERQYSAGMPDYHIPPTHAGDWNYPEFYTQVPHAQPTFEGYKGQHGPTHLGNLWFTEPYSPKVLTPPTHHRDDRYSRPHPHVYPTLPTHNSDGRHLSYAPRGQMYSHTLAYFTPPTINRDAMGMPFNSNHALQKSTKVKAIGICMSLVTV